MFAPEGSATKLIILCAVTSVLSNFLEGYCSAYPNTADDEFEIFLNRSFVNRSQQADGLSKWSYTWFWSTFLNIWFIGFLIGTLSTAIIADRYGRKSAILIANGINLFATIVSSCSIYFCLPELLVIGRLIGATGSGLSMNSLILFVQEISPTALRGTCSFLSEGTFIAANVLGMGLGMDLMLGRNLFLLVGVAAIPSAFGILIMIPLEESPKYLLINKNDRKAAVKALTYYQGIYFAGHNINHSEILEETLKESDTNKIDLPLFQAIGEVWHQAYLRKAITIGILSLQIIVGIWPIIYNSTELLEAHMKPKKAQFASFLFITANFLASIVGMCAVEKLGRRPMLLYCGVANTVCLSLFILFDRLTAYLSTQFRIGCVAALVGYGITYGIAVGPIAAFITSELVPQRCRSLVQSIVYSVNTILIFVLSFITLPLYRLIGVWAFVPLFIVPSIFSLIYLFMEMPETRGRKIHEIVAELMSSSDGVLSNSKIDGIINVPLNLVNMDSMPEILTRDEKSKSNIAKLSVALSTAGKKIKKSFAGFESDKCGKNDLYLSNKFDVPRIVVKSESNSTISMTLDELCTKKNKKKLVKS